MFQSYHDVKFINFAMGFCLCVGNSETGRSDASLDSLGTLQSDAYLGSL